MDEVYNIIKILIIHFPFSDKYLEIPAWSGFIVFLPGLQLAGQTSPAKKYKSIQNLLKTKKTGEKIDRKYWKIKGFFSLSFLGFYDFSFLGKVLNFTEAM